MSRRPCEAVKVVVRAPAASEPWTVPATPPSLCISITRTGSPNRLLRPAAAHSSVSSAMTLEGVMG